MINGIGPQGTRSAAASRVGVVVPDLRRMVTIQAGGHRHTVLTVDPSYI